MDPVRNFAIVEVSTGYDNDDVAIVLQAGHGARLPAPVSDGAFNLTWWNAEYPNPADDPNVEIVRVTARSTDTLTITRAQEGTAASNKNSGALYKMALAPTKKTIDDLVTELATKLTKGGDSPGAQMSFGTNTNQHVEIRTNNTARGYFLANGGFYWGVNGVVIGNVSTVSGYFRVSKNSNPRAAYSTGMGQFAGDDGAGNHILIDVANTNPVIIFRHSGGTMQTPTATASGNFIGGIQAYGYDTSNFFLGGRLEFAASETWGTTAHGTAIWFYTTPNTTTTATAQMVLDSFGRLGIGDTSPIPKVEIAGSFNANTGLGAAVNQLLILRYSSATNGAGAGLGFAVTNTDDNMTALIVGHRIGGNGQGQLRFHTKQSTSAGSSFPPVFAMLIDEVGSVFIGGTAAAAHASALLEMSSTAKGFLPPRMTTAQKNAIGTPAEGLVVYDTDLHKLCVRVAAAWETITSS